MLIILWHSAVLCTKNLANRRLFVRVLFEEIVLGQRIIIDCLVVANCTQMLPLPRAEVSKIHAGRIGSPTVWALLCVLDEQFNSTIMGVESQIAIKRPRLSSLTHLDVEPSSHRHCTQAYRPVRYMSITSTLTARHAMPMSNLMLSKISQ